MEHAIGLREKSEIENADLVCVVDSFYEFSRLVGLSFVEIGKEKIKGVVDVGWVGNLPLFELLQHPASGLAGFF